MKSTEVYKIIRQALAAWCKEQGFRRTAGGMLGWYQPLGDRFIVFWFQVSQDGWDEYAGSGFIVEFQISAQPIIGAGSYDRRWRIPKFLDADELGRAHRIQNDVIANLEKPDRSYQVFQLGDGVVQWYLAKFNPVVEPYLSTDDIWLRYKTREDVERWAVFVKGLLPKIVPLLAARAG